MGPFGNTNILTILLNRRYNEKTRDMVKVFTTSK